MPARFAISTVDPPWSPRSANSTIAASRISSRRSSALFRSLWTTMGVMLVTTYKLVKCPCHLVEIALREPRGEREREGPLEGAIGARERALLAEGTEAVERVGADLRLDPLRSQRPEDLVAPLDLDDVGLPPVDVALVRGGQHQRQVIQAFVVGGRQPLACRVQLAQTPQLRDADRAEDVREPVVEAGRRHVV